jgi:D-alanyl-D-alanine-carboxypeptidase/D-alanyl-D-alanine-endopeptidase
MRRLVLSAVMLAACSGPAPAPTPERPAAPAPAAAASVARPAPADPVQALLDQRVRKMLRARPQGGVVVGVVQQNRARVYGYGRVGPHTQAVPNGDTVYEIGSLSQVLAGILLADAAERGKLALEDLASRHLPRGTRVLRHDSARIRLWHLASHTSGLPAVSAYERRSPFGSSRQLLRFVGKQALAHAPGSAYQESMAGVAVVGLALERTLRKDYESLLFERVLLPLGMASTRAAPSASMATRLARGHDAAGQAVPDRSDAKPLRACCALRSTVHDLLRVVAAYLRSDGQLSPALDATLVVRTRREDGMGVGLGWLIDEQAALLHQRGRRPGFDGFAAVHRGRGVGVVVLANSEGWDLEALGRDVLARLGTEPAQVSRSRSAADRDP